MGGDVNLRDSIPQGDDQRIPLQFIFEPANCRIFYTPETVLSPLALWEQVHDIAWMGGKCAWGGMDTQVSNNGSGVGVPGNGSSPSGSVPVSNDAAGAGGVPFVVAGVAVIFALFL